MTKQEFREFIKDRIVFLDGATGSNLMLRGMPGGVCPEKWIMENTQVLIGLQKEYVAAGANILYAPTFTANPVQIKGIRPGRTASADKCRDGGRVQRGGRRKSPGGR